MLQDRVVDFTLGWLEGRQGWGLTLQSVQAKSPGEKDPKHAGSPGPQAEYCHRPPPGWRPIPGGPPGGSGERKGLTVPKGHRPGRRGGRLAGARTRKATQREQEQEKRNPRQTLGVNGGGKGEGTEMRTAVGPPEQEK